MPRPGFVPNAPKPNPKEVAAVRTKLPDPKLQPADRPDGPSTLDLAFAKYEKRLRRHLEKDLEFDVHQVATDATYYQKYVPAAKAVGIDPMAMLYCNFCWNRWPLVGVFAMDKYSLVTFLRGQCCPSCDNDPQRFNHNDSLHRIGPSKYFIEQAQRVGFATFRFPALDPNIEPRFAGIWAQGAPNRGYAEKLWQALRPLVHNPINES